MNTIADQIRALRKTKGFSQETLAENAGINLRTLQRIETGNVIPRGETLRLLAAALDASVEKLAEVDKSPNTLQDEPAVLKLMSLSALTFWFIPLGNIFFPLVFWILKRNTVAGANELGKRILSFQIIWSVVTYGLAYAMMFLGISGRFGINPFSMIYVFGALALGNTIYIFATLKSWKGAVQLFRKTETRSDPFLQ